MKRTLIAAAMFAWAWTVMGGMFPAEGAFLPYPPVCLTPLDGVERRHPQWSPDGNWIVYFRKDDYAHYGIFKVHAGGGPEFFLAADGSYPQWSPDGNWIVFTRDGINKVSSAGGAVVPVIGANDPVWVWHPQWSPDGKWILYPKWERWGEASRSIGVFKVRSSGDLPEIQLLKSTSIGVGRYAEWSPDGNDIVCEGSPMGRLSKDGGQPFPITQDQGDEPQWSPDGQWIVYVRSDGSGHKQVYRVSSWGGQEFPITQSDFDHRFPQWSPPGDRIVFARTDDYAFEQICMMPAWGGEEFVLDTVPYTQDGNEPQWSPDGRWIVYVSEGDIYKVLSSPRYVTPTATPTFRPTPTPTATPTPVTGWSRAESDVPISGLLLYGNKFVSEREMGGLPCSLTPKTKHYLAHFASTARWYTGVVVANPNGSQATVTFDAYSDGGGSLGTTSQSIPANGKVSMLVSQLFDPAISGNGWIEVTSDIDTVVFDLYGDRVSGGIGALPGSELGSSLTFAHFSQSNRWWTGVTLLNPSDNAVNVTLNARQNDGTSLDEETFQILARSKLVGMVEALLPLAANQSGWISVEASGGQVGGILVYGDKQATPNRIAALSAAPASTTLNLSAFYSDTEWWTGIAVVNPSDSTSATLTLSAYTGSGSLISQKTNSLPALNKTVGLVSSLFTLGSRTEGWTEITSTSPAVGLEILNADDPAEEAWGLAAIESQASGMSVYLPHQVLTSRWWTLFALANPDNSSTATVNLNATKEDGTSIKSMTKIINPNGNIADYLRDLFGL